MRGDAGRGGAGGRGAGGAAGRAAGEGAGARGRAGRDEGEDEWGWGVLEPFFSRFLPTTPTKTTHAPTKNNAPRQPTPIHRASRSQVRGRTVRRRSCRAPGARCRSLCRRPRRSRTQRRGTTRRRASRSPERTPARARPRATGARQRRRRVNASQQQPTTTTVDGSFASVLCWPRSAVVRCARPSLAHP